MQDNFYLDNLGDDEVFEFENNNLIKTGQFKEVISKVFTESKIPNTVYEFLANRAINIPKQYDFKGTQYCNDWFRDGVYCRLLQLGSKEWQPGKIRIRVSVEFIPDEPEIIEPESPLDDIRKKMTENNLQ